jgi:hypothetical protein
MARNSGPSDFACAQRRPAARWYDRRRARQFEAVRPTGLRTYFGRDDGDSYLAYTFREDTGWRAAR